MRATASGTGVSHLLVYRPDTSPSSIVRFVRTARDLPALLADLRASRTRAGGVRAREGLRAAAPSPAALARGDLSRRERERCGAQPCCASATVFRQCHEDRDRAVAQASGARQYAPQVWQPLAGRGPSVSAGSRWRNEEE